MATEQDTPREQTQPPRALVRYIIATSFVSSLLFLLLLLCPLNAGKDESAATKDENAAAKDQSTATKDGDATGNALKQRHVFVFTTTMMFVAGTVGGCASNLRRIVEHTTPGPFDPIYSLSYYLRPISGGIAGLIVFFLLLGGAMSLNIGSVGDTKAWMTLTGRAPYIAFTILAGYGSREFGLKLHDLTDSLFALSNNKKKK